MRRSAAVVASLLCLVLAGGLVSAAPPARATPGAAGVGDPYFPMDGNGGYDVGHYDLDLTYDPGTGVLAGVATISATATQDLSRFNLDFDGLKVRSVTVNGAAANQRRSRGELTVTPKTALLDGATFTVVVTYDGVPEAYDEGPLGVGGWIATDDGAIALGQPHGATTWFPANDHPIDKATLTVALDVPAGLEAISNGRLAGSTTDGGRTTWTWDVSQPMATYLAMAAIGEFEIDDYDVDGIDGWDAIDPDLLTPIAAPSTGTSLAMTGTADSAYLRLARTISVPAGGATLAFDVTYDIEQPWDFLFVEAHTVGADDWTTLPDQNGHTSQDTGFVCPYWLDIHPFLAHYQTATRRSCEPTGTTGAWWAATGASGGIQEWVVDLSAYAGDDVEVAITYASDDIVQVRGVFVDDVVVSTGAGTTSFEDDGDPMDGWSVPGAPDGSPGNASDWFIGTAADITASQGSVATAAFARHGEVVDHLAAAYGPYPFTEIGGVVDDQGLGFALETQTRPVYDRFFFDDPLGADSVVVHELAHQWVGDSVALERWGDIWLNEGFATYMEWTWSEAQGLGTAQAIFDIWTEIFPADDAFWLLPIGDPGPDALFDFAVYIRGAMTLHALRGEIGDTDFSTLLETWASDNAGGNVRTADFIALAESVSGQQLDAFFDAWLFGAGLPVAAASTSSSTARAAGAGPRAVPAVARSLIARYGDGADILP